jgi:hypothetical protein
MIKLPRMKMKQSIYSISVFFITIAMVGCSGYTDEPTINVEKTLKESFDTDVPSELIIDNEYGDINIETWDQSKMEIMVHILAQSNDKSRAQKFVDGTSVDFSQEGKRIFAITQLGPTKAKKRWFSWGSDNHTYTVNYSVRMPEQMSLKLENDYGSIFIGDFDGDLDVDLSYGEIHTQNITGKTKLDIKYGEVRTGKIGNAELNMANSEFRSEKTGNLNIKSNNSEFRILEALNITTFSKYDEYTIGKMDNLINEGAYDEFNINKARSVRMTTRFSDLNLDYCEVDLDIEMIHGDVNIDHIMTAFSGGVIEGNHADIDIAFDGNVKVDIISENTDIDLGRDFTREIYEEKRNDKRIKAFIGSSSIHNVLTIRSKYGSVEIN